MNYDKIGEFIAKKRKEKSLTQKDLADLIGVTDKAVSKWERGLGCPDVSILEVLSKELDVSILEILKGRMIENEVIPVTELNDYVLDTVKYSRESIKDRIKKIVSIIITFIIIGICGFLLILNINHMIYLNTSVQNTLSDDYFGEVKSNLELIKSKSDVIKSNQGKYSDEDYKTIIDNIDSIYRSLSNMKILKYNENSEITRNDIYMWENSFGIIDIFNIYKILAKYNSKYNDYYELSMSSWIVQMSFNPDSVLRVYKYRLADYENDSYQIYSDAIKKIQHAIYIEKETLYMQNILIEVGDINE